MKRSWLAVPLLVAACGGGAKPGAAPPALPSSPAVVATTPSGLSQSAQAQAYLAAAEAPNDASQAFFASVKTNDDGPTVAKKAVPLLSAFRVFDNKLARIAFTGAAAADSRAVIAADGILEGDLASVGNVNAFSLSAFTTTFGRDAGALRAAVTSLRADLGLPPK